MLHHYCLISALFILFDTQAPKDTLVCRRMVARILSLDGVLFLFTYLCLSLSLWLFVPACPSSPSLRNPTIFSMKTRLSTVMLFQLYSSFALIQWLMTNMINFSKVCLILITIIMLKFPIRGRQLARCACFGPFSAASAHTSAKLILLLFLSSSNKTNSLVFSCLLSHINSYCDASKEHKECLFFFFIYLRNIFSLKWWRIT